jgi:hypothetical protein
MSALLLHLLKTNAFPYQECNLNRQYDQYILDFIKENTCTLSENDLVISVQQFYARTPNAPIRLFEVKLYDEPMKASMVS